MEAAFRLSPGKNEGLPTLPALAYLHDSFSEVGWCVIVPCVREDSVAPQALNYFMSVKIRMKRIGTKNTPAFRIVVADSRSPRDGKCIEEIGTYLPERLGENFTLKLERANYWVSKGAQPSDTVASFIKKARKAAAVAPAPLA